jgi:tetratricopeptide (TPR) repeat protein
MAERAEEPDAEAPDSSPSGADGLAAALIAALGRRGNDAKTDPEFEAFLRRQSRLVDLQTEHLHEQRELILSRLHWGRYSDRMKALLQTLTVLLGLAIVIAVAAMAWEAHKDHGVSIAAFSVPPDLAQRGLTGQVVASELLDRLADLQAQTVTARPASTYANDWGGDIKVEIPETGVSIGELNRYLHEWLGNETRITGEVVRTPAGLIVAARAGATPAGRFVGAEGDLESLIQRAAEVVYAQTQPYRYAVYLASTGRQDQALAAYKTIAQTGAREDRPWAYAGWAALVALDDPIAGGARARDALALGAPPQSQVFTALYGSEAFASHWEAERAVGQDADRLGVGASGLMPSDAMKGDYRGAAKGDRRGAAALRPKSSVFLEGEASAGQVRLIASGALSLGHDIASARGLIRGLPPEFADSIAVIQGTGFWAFVDEDWRRIERSLRSPRLAFPGDGIKKRAVAAGLAVAVAMQGRQAEAEALVATTPLDCDLCVDARAVIAERGGNWPAAERWITLLEARTPSIPFAPTEHGKLLLDRGETDAAIAELEKAHRLGPHFADPLELWGEALTTKRDYVGAARKFAEADQDAPKWGRNHLRWGEALMLAGRYREARAQYETANGLDLSIADRGALKVLLARTAAGPLHG